MCCVLREGEGFSLTRMEEFPLLEDESVFGVYLQKKGKVSVRNVSAQGPECKSFLNQYDLDPSQSGTNESRPVVYVASGKINSFIPVMKKASTVTQFSWTGL